MSFQIEIPDEFLPEEEIEKLKLLFSEADIKLLVEKLALASLDEYKNMLFNQGIPSSIKDIRETRLFYLIKNIYKESIPNELQVSSIFQISESKSKALILSVIARFRNKLEEQINFTIAEIISKAMLNEEESEYELYIDSSNFIDEINHIIRKSGVEYRLLSKIKGEDYKYSLALDSYQQVRNYLAQRGF